MRARATGQCFWDFLCSQGHLSCNGDAIAIDPTARAAYRFGLTRHNGFLAWRG